jgi:hypothetical protein
MGMLDSQVFKTIALFAMIICSTLFLLFVSGFFEIESKTGASTEIKSLFKVD